MKCNLLMALMQLDIGGAETHVVELAKEFRKEDIIYVLPQTAEYMLRSLRRQE